MSVVGADDNYETFPLLRAPFVNPKNLLITKKYTSLESGDTLVSGSPIEVTLELKNTSSSNISGVIVQEKIPSFLEVADMKYDLFE